jgi:exonuclease VII large subunit
MAVLDSLGPLTVLRRGYAIVRCLPDGSIVRKATEVSEKSMVEVRVASGRFEAKVVSVYREQE